MHLEPGAEAFVERMQRLLNEERVEELAGLFTEKLPVYSQHGTTLYLSRADTEVSIRRLLFAARAAGTKALEHRILSMRPAGEGSATAIHIEWHYLDGHGDVVATGEMRYFCGPDADGAFRVLMIDYVRAAFPDALTKMPKARATWGRPN